MEQIYFGQRIASLRKAQGMTQEALAQVLGITNQAVSKWETDQCCPDIMQLPVLADLFGISMDTLFGRPEAVHAQNDNTTIDDLPWPDNDDLHAVCYIGHKLVNYQEILKSDKRATFSCFMNKGMFRDDPVVLAYTGTVGNIHSDFSVTCQDVRGNVQAGESITCGDVGGQVSAGEGISCGNIQGGAFAGDSINCVTIGTYAQAGDDIRCTGMIGGNVQAGGDLTCTEIGGRVQCDGDVSCEGNIQGDVKCEGDITCGDIFGNASAEGDIEATAIHGDAKAEGDISCETIGGNAIADGEILDD